MRPHRQQPTRLPRPWDSPGKNTGVGCHFLLQCMKVKSESEVSQSCPTLSDPMNWSLPGSSVHGIFQTRVLWGLLSFFNLYISLGKFGRFSAIIFLSTFFFFQLCPLLPLFIGYMIQMLDLLVESHRSLRLCSFPCPTPSLFSPLFRLGNFYFSVF